MSSCQIRPKCNKVNNPTVLSGCWHAPRTQRVPCLPDCPPARPSKPGCRSFVPRSAFMTAGAAKTLTKKGRGREESEDRGKRQL